MKISEETITKSMNDSRIYKSALLENNLQVLVVQDKEAEKCAVSMSVGVGSLQDPKDFNGIAHFLEHMLFLGTDKYPVAGEYKEFLSRNGGTCNAYTSETETNYYFQVKDEGLEGALDRFSQFFISPQLTEELSQREIKAVNSEHTKNISNDSRRENQLLKVISDPSSEFNHFSTGNLETLDRPEVRQQLKDFHSKWYSSNLMKLCLVTTRHPDTVLELAENMFQQILNKDKSKPECKVGAYTNDIYKGRMIELIPETQNDRIKITFYLDCTFVEDYKGNPSGIVSSLIGHEGEHSLLSQLREEGLATRLSAGGSDRAELFHLFSVVILLTPLGYQSYNRVIQLVFQYIAMLKHNHSSIQQWYFQERAQVKQLAFRFKSNQKPLGTSVDLATSMHHFAIKDVLSHGQLYSEWKHDKFIWLLDQLTPSNMNLILISKKLLNDNSDDNDQSFQKEQYYGLQYRVSPLEQEALDLFNAPSNNEKMQLPIQNTYIANDLSLVSAQQPATKEPKRISANLFHKQDNRYLVPKAAVFIKLHHEGMTSGDERVFNAVWKELVQESVNEEGYLAEEAMLYAAISVSPSGVQLTCQGFNHKLNSLISTYLNRIINLKLSNQKDQFQNVIAQIRNNHLNFTTNQSYQIATHLLNSAIMVNGQSDFISLRQSSAKFNTQTFQQIQSKWLQQVRAEVFVTGNLDEKQAKDIEQLVNDTLQGRNSLQQEEICELRTIKLEEGQHYFYEWQHENKAEKNSAAVKCFQLEKQSFKTDMLLALTVQLFKTANFEQLRTVEQLGYSVFTSSLNLRGIQHFSVTVQSDVKGPHALINRIDAALIQNYQKILDMDDQSFQQYKQSVASNLKVKNYSLYEEAHKHWHEINNKQLVFDRKQKYLQILEDIDKKSVEDFINTHIMSSGTSKIIEMLVPSQQHSEQDLIDRNQRVNSISALKKIHSIQSFQRNMHTNPDYYAFY